jgi:PAS domain-containing protein
VSQNKETGREMAGVAVVALIVGGEAKERPALFPGNASLRPMNFMKNGKPTGIVVDLAKALADIRGDGTYDRIIKSWRSKEVVFKTREQLRQQARLIAAISVALFVAWLSIAALVIEIRRRKRGETTRRESEARLDLALLSAHMGVWHWDIIANRKKSVP